MLRSAAISRTGLRPATLTQRLRYDLFNRVNKSIRCGTAKDALPTSAKFKRSCFMSGIFAYISNTSMQFRYSLFNISNGDTTTTVCLFCRFVVANSGMVLQIGVNTLAQLTSSMSVNNPYWACSFGNCFV
jgi:hypothetical protein